MGLFNLFKKSKVIHDDFFGALRHLKPKDQSKNFFSDCGVFLPTGLVVGYTIVADVSGPTFQQRDFYKKLQQHFDVYLDKMKPLLENEFKNWKEDFIISDFNKEFSLISVTIPKLDTSPVLWNMSFDTIHDSNHQFTVNFIDDNPERVSIDG